MQNDESGPEGEESAEDSDEPGAVGRGAERARREAEADLAAVQKGESVSLFGEQVPKRSLAALAIFIAAFAASVLLLWALFGGLGLAIGIIVGGLAGFLAVRYTVGTERSS